RAKLLSRRATDAGKAAESRQQHASSSRADPWYVVERRSQVALRPRTAMKRDGETVCLVPDSLHEQQGRIMNRQCDRIVEIARVEQFFFLRDANGHKIPESERFERRVCRRQLTFSAVDQD